jgi:hypothetical protein
VGGQLDVDDVFQAAHSGEGGGGGGREGEREREGERGREREREREKERKGETLLLKMLKSSRRPSWPMPSGSVARSFLKSTSVLSSVSAPIPSGSFRSLFSLRAPPARHVGNASNGDGSGWT